MNSKITSRTYLKKVKLDDSEEIDEIISLQKKLYEANINNNINLSIDKSLDWLNFFFADEEIRSLYNNFERIRSILIIQSIFYLNLFKNLLNFRNKFSNNSNEKEDNIYLNIKNKSSKKFIPVNPDQLPVINFNNSILYNNFNPNTNNNNINFIGSTNEFQNDNEISNIQNLNDLIDVDNNFQDKKVLKSNNMNKKFNNTESTNFKGVKALTNNFSNKKFILNKSVNLYNFPNQNIFNIGIIGCGSIGEALAKYLIKIKDSNLINFKLIISTRRPNKIDEDIKNLIDENIQILLDNEKV